MSPNAQGAGGRRPRGAHRDEVLSAEQQQTWLAWMRVALRMTYEMNHQLMLDEDLSLSDYHVLNALADSPDRRLGLSTLAARISWERSRLSHYVKRMEGRGLVTRRSSQTDRRVTEVELASDGEAALRAATPGHLELVARLFFSRLDPSLVAPLREALDQVHEELLTSGTLPHPGPPQHRLPPA